MAHIGPFPVSDAVEVIGVAIPERRGPGEGISEYMQQAFVVATPPTAPFPENERLVVKHLHDLLEPFYRGRVGMKVVEVHAPFDVRALAVFGFIREQVRKRQRPLGIQGPALRRAAETRNRDNIRFPAARPPRRANCGRDVLSAA